MKDDAVELLALIGLLVIAVAVLMVLYYVIGWGVEIILSKVCDAKLEWWEKILAGFALKEMFSGSITIKRGE